MIHYVAAPAVSDGSWHVPSDLHEDDIGRRSTGPGRSGSLVADVYLDISRRERQPKEGRLEFDRFRRAWEAQHAARHASNV